MQFSVFPAINTAWEMNRPQVLANNSHYNIVVVTFCPGIGVPLFCSSKRATLGGWMDFLLSVERVTCLPP